MSYVTGWNTFKIKTFSHTKFILRCAEAQDQGYELHKKSVKRDWPRFWRVKYKAEYRKYYIIDDSKIAYFNKEQFDYIKSGIIKK